MMSKVRKVLHRRPTPTWRYTAHELNLAPSYNRVDPLTRPKLAAVGLCPTCTSLSSTTNYENGFTLIVWRSFNIRGNCLRPCKPCNLLGSYVNPLSPKLRRTIIRTLCASCSCVFSRVAWQVCWDFWSLFPAFSFLSFLAENFRLFPSLNSLIWLHVSRNGFSPTSWSLGVLFHVDVLTHDFCR